jgi:Na+-translocating ferredoxin:NAD+ oxidoreductase RNF subunit RnfB
MGHSKHIFDLLLRLWPLYKLGLRLGCQPAIGTVLKPAFSTKIHQVTMLPVNEPIPQGEQTVLPYSMLQELAERASARFIMNECVCRTHEDCRSYPTDLGCLFLGEGAARIHPSLGRLCDTDEASQHIRRGLQAGLYPLIAHTVIDAFTLGIPYKRMLTVCFCCECCCVVQRGLRKGPATLLKAIQPLPGLKVVVGEECAACGECVDACPVGAISMNHHAAKISPECKGCGICLNTCPYGAITLEMDGNADIMAACRDQIRGYADISSSIK